jgi:hypothetical protein
MTHRTWMTTSWRLWCAVLVLALVAGSSGSAPAVQAAPLVAPAAPQAGAVSLKLVGQYGGAMKAVTIAHPVAFVGRGPRVEVYNVLAYPDDPLLLGRSTMLPDIVRGIAYTPGYHPNVYVATGRGDLRLIQADAGYSSLTEVAAYSLPGEANDVAITHGYLYVGTTHGLFIFSLADPASPQQIGQFPGVNVHRLTISGNLAYLAMGGAGLALVDIADRTNPELVKIVENGNSVLAIRVLNGYAYAANASGGLAVLDVDPPALASVVAQVSLNSARDVVVQGSYAYLGLHTGYVHVINISNPLSPTKVASVDLVGDNVDLAIAGGRLYSAQWRSGLSIANVSTPTDPQRIGGIGSADNAVGVAVANAGADPVVYVSNDLSGVRAISAADAENPTSLGTFKPSSNQLPNFWKMALSGNRAYVADLYTGLRVLNVSNPSGITQYSALALAAHTYDVVLQGSYAYLASGGKLVVASLSNPISPTVAGSVDLTYGAWGLAVAGSYAYVANAQGGLRIISISNPAAPTVVGTLGGLGNATHVAVQGNYAYVTRMEGGLAVVNVANPQAPFVAGNHPLYGDSMHVTVRDQRAYVADGRNGVVVLDITTPSQLVQVGHFDTYYAWDLALNGPYIYVADDDNGFLVLEEAANHIYLPLVRR